MTQSSTTPAEKGALSELLPCPFCGGSAKLENYIVEAAAFCLTCRATIKHKHASNEDTGIRMAVDSWNRRPALTELRALRAERKK